MHSAYLSQNLENMGDIFFNNDTQIIDPVADERWDKFVESHPFGWICHLSGWRKVLEESFTHLKGYFLALINREGEIKAGLPIYEIRSWLTDHRLVSIPFATLCDPLISTKEEMEILFNAAIILLRRCNASYIEIRTLSSAPLICDERFGARSFYKHHYLLLDIDPEQLKRKFHRSCVRQRISRAVESQMSFRIGDRESDLENFYQLHKMTRKRLSLPPQPYCFFKSLWDTFWPKRRIIMLMAEKEGKGIASLILFKFKNRVSAEFAASDEAYKHFSPNHFLFWEAIKLAYREGYKIIDFG